MSFNTEEYYLYKFSGDDCYDENGVWFDEGYTLALCEKFTRDRVHFQVLTWEFGNLGWMEMSFLEYSPEAENFQEMNDANKSILFNTVFAGNYLGDGGPQFGFIFNRSEEN